MARLTELDELAIRELCARFSLGQLVSWQPIEAGTVNSNFRVDTTTGSFFLRVNEGKDESEVAYEAQLVESVAGRGVPTPVPLDSGGRPYTQLLGKWISAFPWIMGCHVSESEVTARHAARIGGALASFHLAADGVVHLPRRFGRYTEEAIRGRLDGLGSVDDTALVGTIALLTKEAAWLERHPASQADGLIHGDLFCDNVLWNEAGEIVALIDFEQASLGRRSYDLAVTINAWCCGSGEATGCTAALIKEYSHRIGAPDWDALYRDLRCAAWRFTVTRITDVYLRGVHSPAKDFRDYQRRLERWQAMTSDEVRSLCAD